MIHQRTQAKPYISVPQVANLSKERDGQNFAVYIIVGDDVLSPAIIETMKKSL